MWRDPEPSPLTRIDGLILGIETSCDETAAALVTRDGEIRANVVASQAELHARVRRRRARRSRRGGTSSSSRRSSHEALDEAGATLDDVDTVAVTRGPGLIGALLVGLAAAKALAWARGLPLVPVNHLHGHVASLYLQPQDARAAVHLPARERRAHAAARRARPDVGRCARARHDARRRRRRGVRQGRAPARARLPGRRRDRPARARGRSRGVRLPGRARAGARLLVLGAQDRAALRGARPRARTSSRRAGPTSPRATSARSCGRSSGGSRPPGADTVAIVGGVAANSELRASLPGRRRCAARRSARTMPR